jgi:hypothetical protein
MDRRRNRFHTSRVGSSLAKCSGADPGCPAVRKRASIHRSRGPRLLTTGPLARGVLLVRDESHAAARRRGAFYVVSSCRRSGGEVERPAFVKFGPVHVHWGQNPPDSNQRTIPPTRHAYRRAYPSLFGPASCVAERHTAPRFFGCAVQPTRSSTQVAIWSIATRSCAWVSRWRMVAVPFAAPS